MNRLYRTPGRRESGLSLIELMIALAVIAIALFSLMQLILHSGHNKELYRERMLAKQAAIAKLEEIKAATFSTIVGTYDIPPANTFVVEGLRDESQVDNLARGVITIDSTNLRLLDITVVVTWDGLARTETYTARSLVTE